MQITVNIPDEIAERLIPCGEDSARFLLELSGVWAYRQARISERTLQVMLGFDSIFEVQEFLKARLGGDGPDTVDSVERELTALRSRQAAESSPRTA
jgi:hypothetical protein